LGFRATIEALARIDFRRRDYLRCRGLFDAGQLCCFMGRHADAQVYLEESLEIAREIGDKTMIAAVYPPLGMAAVGLGNLTKARLCSEEAVALARELGKRRELAVAVNSLAQLHRMEGRLSVAAPLYDEVLSLARELGDQNAIANSLLNMAMVSIDQNRGERARPMLKEILTITTRVGLRPVGQSSLEVTAGLCAWYEEWTKAAQFFGAAEAQAERAGLRRDAVDEAFLAPWMAKARAALSEPVFEMTADKGRLIPYDDALALASAWLGNELRVA
jgi:tetratricopeptide (TPR) repeat protein